MTTTEMAALLTSVVYAGLLIFALNRLDRMARAQERIAKAAERIAAAQERPPAPH